MTSSRPLYRALAAAGTPAGARALAVAACLCLVASSLVPGQEEAGLGRRPADAGLRGPPGTGAACNLSLPLPLSPLARLPRTPDGAAGALCLVAADEAAWAAAVGALHLLASPPPAGPARPAGAALVAVPPPPAPGGAPGGAAAACPLSPDATLVLSTARPPPPLLPPACASHPDAGDLLAWGRAVARAATATTAGGRPAVTVRLACGPDAAPSLALASPSPSALCGAAVAAGAGLAQLGSPTHRGGAARTGLGAVPALRTAALAGGLASAGVSLSRCRAPLPPLLLSLGAAAGGAGVAWAAVSPCPPGPRSAALACAWAALLVRCV